MFLTSPDRPRRGVAVVELLLVSGVLILLALTVLPQLGAANRDAQAVALRQDLQLLRSQIQLYKFQHDGQCPGAGSRDPKVFLDHLTKTTNRAGQIGHAGSAAHPYGPYLIGPLPANPYNGGRGVRIVDDFRNTSSVNADDEGGERIGWIYCPATGEIKANSSALTANGRTADTF